MQTSLILTAVNAGLESMELPLKWLALTCQNLWYFQGVTVVD
jgi:hypothetical protein